MFWLYLLFGKSFSLMKQYFYLMAVLLIGFSEFRSCVKVEVAVRGFPS